MVEFQILVEGYAHPGKNGEYEASPTSLLLVSNGQRIVVDPGTNKKRLLAGLEKAGVNAYDVKSVFITHYHPDHFLNYKLFPNADLIDGQIIWSDEREIFYSDTISGTEIKVVATPGHTEENTSLLFETKEFGTVAHAADVFWWEDGQQKTDDYEKLLSHIDPFVTDVEKLKASRISILKMADYIIPGHGKMFKNNFKS